MNTTYIYHSGFLVETSRCYYMFDYYRGDIPTLDPLKKVFVFSSHCHSDHYNPTVFALLSAQGIRQIHAVLSEDIDTSTVPDHITVTVVRPGLDYTLPSGQKITAFRSTDEGVAFLIEEEDGLIYHAGDLNDWVWEGEEDSYNDQMTINYRTEIDKLADKLKDRTLDLAFVVLDPRQEQHYDRGMLYFLSKLPSKQLYPMHYWEKPQIIRQFEADHPNYRGKLCFPE